MIQLTRINNQPFVLNADLIEFIETTPDTMIRLTSGQTLTVLESVDEVVNRVVRFRQLISQGAIPVRMGV